MNSMLSRALREFNAGPLNQLLVNLGGEEGEIWETELKKFLRKEPTWVPGSTLKPGLPPILIALAPITVAATPEFDAAKRIVVDTSRKAKPRIAYVDQSVKNDIAGLVEPAQPAVTLYPHRTTRTAPYSVSREALGGEKVVRTTYAKIFKLVEAQPNGEEGDLLVNGNANLFEVEVNGVPRLVGVLWHGWGGGRGWVWGSRSVGDSREWRAGRRVFSGNPRPVAT